LEIPALILTRPVPRAEGPAMVRPYVPVLGEVIVAAVQAKRGGHEEDGFESEREVQVLKVCALLVEEM
jgi:hypothetical protein